MAEITLSEIALDLRIIADPNDAVPAAEASILARLVAAVKAFVDQRTNSPPEALRNTAISVMVGYLYDKPSASGGNRYANAWANSGASTILSNHVTRTAVTIEADD